MFVYSFYFSSSSLDYRQVSANEDIPEQIDISTPWSSPRRSMERCATHYSDLAEFIARHACDLDGNSDKDVCVSMTGEGGSSEIAKVGLAHDTSRSLTNYGDETVTELVSDGTFVWMPTLTLATAQTSLGSVDVAKEHHATDTDPDFEWSYEDTDGECKDVEELLDELSDVESYVTAEGGDVEIEMEIHDEKLEGKTYGQEAKMKSLFEPFSELESVMFIDDSSTDDEFGVRFLLFFNYMHDAKGWI